MLNVTDLVDIVKRGQRGHVAYLMLYMYIYIYYCVRLNDYLYFFIAFVKEFLFAQDTVERVCLV